MPWRWFAGLLALAGLARPAVAELVRVPLQFDYPFIRQALLAQVYAGPQGLAVLWDDGSGCNFLRLRDPEVSGAGGHVQVVTHGSARVGTRIGSECLAPVQWDGIIELAEAPAVSPDQRRLQFKVTESNIYDAQRHKRFLSGRIWDLVKQYVQPRFESVHIDLDAAATDLHGVLPLFLPGPDAQRINQILDSLRLSDAVASDAGVSVQLSFMVTPVPQPTAPTPEPTLTAEEIRRWEAAWQRWDAFLTFVVKQSGHDAATPELRQALADVLIEARFDILQALAPPSPNAPDPTRALFLKTWERLAPVLRRTASTLPGATAARYLSFITAADALAALDRIGADIGLDISADGLRRLARIVAPGSTEDPVAYSTAVDADLRQVFGFGPPLPPPDLSGAPPATAWWRRLFATRPAIAAPARPGRAALQQWLADRDRIDAYLKAVRGVLDDATRHALASGDLQEPYREVYRRLVLAAAWQESCWRQFVRQGAGITYLKSAVGSTGMMQVNEHVWRGFYDLRGLRWDIRYNGRAGSEILLHYLRDYAVARHEDQKPGGADNLARATYAVYNGGPGQLTRYRQPHERKTLKKIDRLFYEKYQAVSAGKEMQITQCLVGE